MMSEKVVRDHLSISEISTSESSTKDIISNTFVKHTNENGEDKQTKNMDLLIQAPINGDEDVNCTVEIGAPEVEYIESEELDDFEDVDKSLKMLISGLESKNWVLLCETLNNVRRFSIYHKEALQDILDIVISLIVKSIKNPRSAVCKTSIMTCADIFKAFGDQIIDLLDPLLVQLLLKSSQDKRFVCEAAEKALVALTTCVSTILLLPKLQPYLKNRNPRVRAKASLCISRSVPRLGAEEIRVFGMEKLIQIAASQLNDKLPESREAARALLLDLQTKYEKTPVFKPEPELEPEPEQDATYVTPQVYSWDQFCESNLSKLSAQAVLRVTSAAHESLVAGS